jgi:hypothetical protein
MDFQDISADVQQVSVAKLNLPPPPYTEEKNFKEKFSLTQ